MENEKVKKPLYKEGTLICPHCHLPLVAVEKTYFRIRCSVCHGLIGKVPFYTLRRMITDMPDSLFEEWMVELKNMRHRRNIRHG